MKSFALVAVVLVVVAVVDANMFGSGGAFKKKFPGAKPMSYEEYMKLQHQKLGRPTQPPKPSTNWMLDTPTQVANQRGRPAAKRPTPVRPWQIRSPGYSSESDYSREDD